MYWLEVEVFYISLGIEDLNMFILYIYVLNKVWVCGFGFGLSGEGIIIYIVLYCLEKLIFDDIIIVRSLKVLVGKD